MERTRFEVRLAAPRRSEPLVGAGHRRGGVLPVAQPRRRSPAPGAHRLGRRAVACHAGAQDAGRRRTHTGQDADLRRGRRRHRRPGRDRGRARSCARWASGSRCCASRTCRRSPPPASTHFHIEKTSAGTRTTTSVAGSTDDGTSRGARADDGRRRGGEPGPGEGAGAARSVAGERWQSAAKAKGESAGGRKRK